MAKQTSTEEESNLKKQARHRLIGAVVLVLAIVLVLPMVFDSEPSSSTANDIELRIPDRDQVSPFQMQAASAPAVDTVVSAAASAPAANTVTTVLPASSVGMTTPVQAAKPVQGDSKHKSEAKPKAETKPKVEAKPKSETKPAAKTIPQSGWVVQVGAYSNADTAKQLQSKLGKQGYAVYTEKAGNMLRVRVGSYPTREAAEKVKHKLEAAGLQPNIVNLE